MKKTILASIITISLILTSCMSAKETSADGQSSNSSGDFSSLYSELPSSSDELSSLESSEVSSIVSEIDKLNSSSKPPASSAVSSKPPASSAVSSKPPASSAVSSKPPTSSAVSSKPPASSAPPQTNSSGKMKAVWLSFLEFQQFSGSSESTFTNKVANIFDTMQNKGINTVLVQVRPHGDAIYPSEHYPWSKSVSKTMGVALDYDPLAIIVNLARQRGLEIHAWINPYRTMTDTEFTTVDSRYKVKEWYESPNRSSYMIKAGNDNRWWLKPGNIEVQQLIMDGAREIMTKYDVDGIHIDDYFYGAAISEYGDSVSQAKSNTTAMVKGLYDTVKSVNSSAEFGVSPAGGFRENSSLPASDQGYLSTDLNLWCKNPGYIDYVMPQVYWGYDHKVQPYEMTLQKWENFVTHPSVDLYIGLAPYSLSTDTIHRQIEDIKNSNISDGYALFRYDHIHGLTLK